MPIIPSKSEERAIERELADLRSRKNVQLRCDVPHNQKLAWDNAPKVYRALPVAQFFRWPPEHVRACANLDDPLPFTLQVQE